jgi:NAD(P)-dependent dehydrogenase (short-subunit alcohol dehydrogenase family)
MGRVQGKVAFITGAARGQGRSHAIRLAEEGADIIAVDICHSLGTVNYQLATSDDLKETAAAIEKLDRRVVAVEADVRDRSQLANALERGIAELGKVDVVVAQAGFSEPMYKSFRPDLEHPTREDATPAFHVQQAMPIPWIEPADVSNMVLFLASDESRYVTGMQMRVDAGGYLKWYDFHK